jgi:hypothetical protein
VRGPNVFEAQHPLLEVKSALEEVAMVIGLQREVLERYDFQPSSLKALITDGTSCLWCASATTRRSIRRVCISPPRPG